MHARPSCIPALLLATTRCASTRPTSSSTAARSRRSRFLAAGAGIAAAASRLTVRDSQVAGTAGAPYGILFAFDAAPSAVLGVVEPCWLVASAPFVGGLLDAQGRAGIAVSLPDLPALQHAQAWLQAMSGTWWPSLHVSTLAGGRVQ